MEFISQQSLGSYGVVFVHDDEDNGSRTSNDFAQSFRVWRILDGKITEHADPLFSPFSSTNAFEV
jgi:predicted SnoaL-like aldol condensation-catalyzing enzyme